MESFPFQFSSSDGQLSLKLLNYTNPSKCLENGACCDSGCQDCDNYFILCLSDPQLDPGCNLGYLWMDEAGNDNFVFTNLIADVDLNDVENPMIYNFPKWNVSINQVINKKKIIFSTCLYRQRCSHYMKGNLRIRRFAAIVFAC